MRIETEVAPHHSQDRDAGGYVDGYKLTLLFEGFRESERFSMVIHGAKTEEEAYHNGLSHATDLAARFINAGLECVIARADVKALEARKITLAIEQAAVEDELRRLAK
jgi:hypothetical protein